MSKKFYFVYLTTNLINGKQYVGDHSTNKLNDNYLGSGKIIIDAIRKHKRKNFKREILEFCYTKQEAFEAQEKYIKEYNTLSPNGYNVSPKGGLCISGCLKHTDETKQKMSNSQKLAYTPERRKNVSENNKNRIITEEQKIKQSISMKGKKHTEKTKNKISESNKGKISPMLGKHHSDESKEKMSKNSGSKRIEVREKIRAANTGKIRSDESRERYSKAKKGITLSEEHKLKLSLTRKEKGLSKGKNNPMSGKSVYSVWMQKYGKEIADKKLSAMKEKMRFKRNHLD